MIDTSRTEAYNKLEMLTGKPRNTIFMWFWRKKKSVLNPEHFREFLERDTKRGRRWKKV